jgi:RNA polymerase sigma-70 factor (ECF subfamily)
MQTDSSPAAPCPPVLDVRAELLRLLPKLRAFAFSLCGRSGGRTERADDLVQETVMKALANIDLFTPGSNMSAWLHTILRNEFYNEFRKRRGEIQDEDGDHAAKMTSPPAQEGHMHFLDFRDALAQLRPDQREALILVGASGFSYEDAATLCSCATGTMKSRVNRARARLAALLAVPEQYSESPGAWALTPALANGRAPSRRNSGYPAEVGRATSSFAIAG